MELSQLHVRLSAVDTRIVNLGQGFAPVSLAFDEYSQTIAVCGLVGTRSPELRIVNLSDLSIGEIIPLEEPLDNYAYKRQDESIEIRMMRGNTLVRWHPQTPSAQEMRVHAADRGNKFFISGNGNRLAVMANNPDGVAVQTFDIVTGRVYPSATIAPFTEFAKNIAGCISYRGTFFAARSGSVLTVVNIETGAIRTIRLDEQFVDPKPLAITDCGDPIVEDEKNVFFITIDDVKSVEWPPYSPFQPYAYVTTPNGLAFTPIYQKPPQ